MFESTYVLFEKANYYGKVSNLWYVYYIFFLREL